MSAKTRGGLRGASDCQTPTSPNPLISVVVPVHNRPDLVIETLESVRAQSYRPLELIIVDDGSTDATGSVIEAWSQRHVAANFVAHVVHQANSGASAARNSGAAQARGDFLQFLDSDDLLLPNKIERQAGALVRAGLQVGYAWCQTLQLSAEGQVVGRLGQPLRDRFNGVPGHHWHISALLLRRTCWALAGGFMEEIRRTGDWEHAARVKMRCGVGLYQPFVGSHYRLHAGPQLIKGDRLEYAQIRERAMIAIGCLLSSYGTPARTGMRRIGWELLKNAVRYARAGASGAALRTAAHAIGWIAAPETCATRLARTSAVTPATGGPDEHAE